MRGALGSYYDVPEAGLGGVRALSGLGAPSGCGCGGSGGGQGAVGTLSDMVKTPLGMLGVGLFLVVGIGAVIVFAEGRS